MLDVRSAGRTIADCASTGSSGPTTSLVAARDRTIPLGDGATPLVLAPGEGICVEVSVSWPERSAVHPDPDHPLDNAVQGDSLTLGVRFDLIQAVG